MSSVFISHSSQDNAAALKIKDWLEHHGHRSLFLDFDPDAGIEAGDRWEASLFDKLRRCQALLALVSNHWTASKWCFAELTQAREHGKLIILATIAPHENKSFSDLQHIDLSQDDPGEYRKLELALSNVFDWDPSRAPYPGLLAFQQEDAAIFFGRDAEIDETQQLLESLRRHRHAGVRFMLMLGASGSGKSSIVRAGLLPRLQRTPEQWLLTIPFQPREEPLTELALTLSHGHDDISWQDILKKLEQSCAANPPDGKELGDLVRTRLIKAGHPDATMLLVIDQAEELFVSSEYTTAGCFLSLIRSALDNANGRLMVLATMRSEFLGVFQTHKFLNDPSYREPFYYEQFSVDPLPISRFKQIIIGPAQRAGLRIQDELVDRLVNDTVTGDALPLLAFSLRRLWEQEHSDRDNYLNLKLSNYEELGGLAGAIEIAADEALDAEHRNPDEIDALRSAFVPGLVRVNAEGAQVRRLALRDELPRKADVILARFVDARLLVSDRDEKGNETLEVAHEALLRAWKRLAEWINLDQDKLRALEALRRAAAEWERLGRREDLQVHRNGRLTDVLTIARESRFAPVVGQVAKDYLQSCESAQHYRERAERKEQQRRMQDAERIAKEQREKLQAQKKTLQRTLIGAGVAAVFALAALIAAWIAMRASSEAELQKNRAVAQQLSAQGELLLQTGGRKDAQLGALLVVESLRRAPDTFLGQKGLASALSYYPPLSREISYDKVNRSNSGSPLAISIDGQFFAASGQNQVTRVWSLKDGKLLHSIKHSDTIKSIEFSYDGAMLATAGDGESVNVWSTSNGQRLLTIPTKGPMQAVVFSRDDKLLAIARDQGSDYVHIYSLPSGKIWKSVDHITGDVVAMDFSPDNRFLVTAGYHQQIEENVTQIWDLRDGGRTARDNHLDSAAVAYSHDGEMVAAGGYDGRVEIWKLKASEYPDEYPLERVVLTELAVGGVQSLAFSPDDSLLAIAGNELVLWDFRAGREVAAFDHNTLLKVAFVDGGSYLATANGEVMRLWNLNRGPEINHELQAQRAPVLVSDMENLLAEICGRIGRSLTEDEWSSFMPGEPMPAPCVDSP